MRLMFFQAYDEGYKVLGDTSSSHLYDYCEAHGYDYLVETNQRQLQTWPVAWEKVALLCTNIGRSTMQHDWLIWVDADMVVANPNFPLKEMLNAIPRNKHLFFSTSVDNSICTGLFGVRPTFNSYEFLKVWLKVGPLNPELEKDYDCRDTWEQNSLKALLRTFPKMEEHVHLLTPPETFLQDPWLPFNQEAWISHFWMGPTRTQERAAEWVKRIANTGWSKEIYEEIKLPRLG